MGWENQKAVRGLAAPRHLEFHAVNEATGALSALR
jgi:hypothetical protein